MIEPTAVGELWADPNFPIVTEEYIKLANKRMPPPKFTDEAQVAYEAQEVAGVLRCWKATHNGVLIGFMSVLLGRSLHFGPGLAIVESIFVMKKHRITGAGVDLLRTAKTYTKDRGMRVLVVQCPYGSSLAKLLEKENFSPELICYCFNP